MSADAFSAFEAVMADPAAVAQQGRRFRDTVLALGGSVPPGEVCGGRDTPCSLTRLAWQVFEMFRGRPLDATALLRSYGL